MCRLGCSGAHTGRRDAEPGSNGSAHRWPILESHRCALLMEPAPVGALRREVLGEWGNWLSSGWDWSWFVTMTFDPKKVRYGTRTLWGWGATARAWDEFMAHLEPERSGQGLDPIWWVRGREPHKDFGGTHFHALVGGISPQRSRRDAWAFLRDHYGLARIEPYVPSMGAAHYLTKYVVKELGDVTFSSNLGSHRRVT